jgi:hypothetical protein
MARKVLKRDPPLGGRDRSEQTIGEDRTQSPQYSWSNVTADSAPDQAAIGGIPHYSLRSEYGFRQT